MKLQLGLKLMMKTISERDRSLVHRGWQALTAPRSHIETFYAVSSTNNVTGCLREQHKGRAESATASFSPPTRRHAPSLRRTRPPRPCQRYIENSFPARTRSRLRCTKPEVLTLAPHLMPKSTYKFNVVRRCVQHLGTSTEQ